MDGAEAGPVLPGSAAARLSRASHRRRLPPNGRSPFASIRRYRLAPGAMDELARRVDEGFAEEIRTRPGFVSYEFVDCEDGEILTISRFAEAGEASRELAQH